MAKKSLQDSWTSHSQEKGGRSSCYLTKKEDKLISVLDERLTDTQKVEHAFIHGS